MISIIKANYEKNYEISFEFNDYKKAIVDMKFLFKKLKLDNLSN